MNKTCQDPYNVMPSHGKTHGKTWQDTASHNKTQQDTTIHNKTQQDTTSHTNTHQDMRGGIPRLYKGLPFAFIQGHLTRFGETGANVGIIPELEGLPLPLKTACGSVYAGLWSIARMPIDTSKTIMSVEGKKGSVGPLYRVALAAAAATAAGRFPCFLTYN